jgi:para-aminobenzoate synthetase/4-amino-4-deoxychorismate lyase
VQLAPNTGWAGLRHYRMSTPFVLFESYDRNPAGRSFRFAECLEEIVATTSEQILPALRRIESAVRNGLHAAGFLSYEAAPAFEPNFRVKAGADFPRLWFGLFKERREISAGDFFREGNFELTNRQASLDERAYCQAVEKIREYIAAGDTYQVNFTLRQRAQFRGDDLALYHRLCRNQRAGYCAYLNLGRYRILSASPELFFHWQNGQLITRPMKGTRPRGRNTPEDRAYTEQLQTFPKERAENLMIVDLLRNDMGRISEFGSVQVQKLFEVERYETVLQMTSTIAARPLLQAGLVEILQALFPSGSVTGAPKIRTMEIIKELEGSPRQIYTGAIGFFSPAPEAVFNVAIRTLLIDTQTGIAELGVGSGVTYDSSPAAEYKECLLKANFLAPPRPDFSLMETLLYESAAGYFLLDRHLTRLADSADYFGFRFDKNEIRAALQKIAENMPEGKFKVRLLLNRDGTAQAAHELLAGKRTLQIALAPEPVDSRDVFLFHKTTHREVYESRRASRPDVDEVLLVNEKGELTESTIANLVVRLEGKDYTPPVSCGLLAGTFRAELLEREKLIERVLRPEDLQKAEAVFLVNSVRGWMPVQMVD